MDQREMTEHEALLGEPLPVELMNTIHADQDFEVYDLVGDGTLAARWVEAVSPRLPPAATTGPASDVTALTDQELRRLRALRDAFRALAAEVTQAPPQFTTSPAPSRQEAIETVNRLSARARVWPVLTWPAEGEPTGALDTNATAADYALSLLARQGSELFAGPQRLRLRACLAPGCDRYFVKDHSRREWCTRACGNRARVARHYRRHHGGAPRGFPTQPGATADD
jgi:predicted RNA-binding Zn ribbon-like protein